MSSEETPFQIEKERIRKRLLKYTKKAFCMLPKLDKPRILDIGCGSGVSTMELARSTNGEIIGLDIDQGLLDTLARKIKKAGISDKAKVVNCSMLDMDFPNGSFDIIWAEGSIAVIGFERGLREWKRFLKANGFLVVHDEKGDVAQKLDQVSSCGYELLGHFIITEEMWRADYFAPLEKLIGKTGIKCANDPEVLEEIRSAQWEIDMFKKNPEKNSSVCFVMKRHN